MIPYFVLVGLGFGVEPGMERIRGCLGRKDDDFLRKIKVEGVLYFTVGKSTFDLEVRDESPGMDAGIRAGAAVEIYFFPEYFEKKAFEELLQGLTVPLALPALIVGALKGDQKSYGTHKTNMSF